MLTFGAIRLALHVAIIAVAVTASRAATIPVGSTADDTVINGNCTLREAVIAANGDTAVDACPAGSGADVIALPAGIYSLTRSGSSEDAAATGDLDLTGDVEIHGAGADNTFIQDAVSDRVIDVDPAGTGVTAALSGLTVRNGGGSGSSVSEGGGIRNAGTLSVTDCAITSNGVHGPFVIGGGVRSTGTLEIVNSRVTDNHATSGTLMVPNGIAAGGGGISNTGTASIVNSTIDGNSAETYASHASQSVGGGLLSIGPMIISGSTISNNLVASLAPTAAGGAIESSAALTLINTTISGNTADEIANVVGSIGGALSVGGATTVINCTITDNLSDFGAIAASAMLTFRNTIVADNGSENCDTTFASGPIIGDAFNLESQDTCGFSGSDLVDTSPLLGPLQDNGGPTFTHLPGAGSPALEGGNPAAPGSGGSACAASDQRGVTRPQFTRCDIGSVEVENPGPCAATLSGCDVPGKSLLLIKDKDGDGAGSGDKLIWKWLKGPATAQEDFGDPTATTDYTLCIYAGTAAVLRAEIPAAGTCGGSPCWKTVGDKGYKRTDSAASSAGIKKILLKGSTSASAKILFKGQGAALDLDPATLPLADDITVQVSHSDNASCWQASYAPAAVQTNSETVFKAKTP